MSVLAQPTGSNYRNENNGSEHKHYYIFASIADGDTFTTGLTIVNSARIDSNHTANVGSSVEIGASTNAGTALTLHVSATGAGRLVVEGH